MMTSQGFVSTLRRVLPEGKELPEEEWNARHRAILVVIAAHAVAVPLFGIVMGNSLVTCIASGAGIGLLCALAAMDRLPRRGRSAVAALALVTSSATIVAFSGGYIEAHFHFFVVLAVIALYQDWAPFLLAIVYVAVDHGVVGALFPQVVYNHGDAYAHPWKWALIHAGLVLGESVALLMGWKVAEEARRRTALVLDSAAEGILGLDLQGAITFANPAVASMLQRPVATLQGARLSEFLHASGDDLLVLRADGRSVPVECERTPIRNNEIIIGEVVTIKDVSERRKAEAILREQHALQAANDRLRELDRLKTQFINNAAHELGTPLTPIKLQAHMLRSEKLGPLSERQLRSVQLLERNVDQLGLLLRDVIDSARVQGGKLEVRRAPVELDRLAREAVESFVDLADQRGVTLAVDAEPVLVSADGPRLTQVLFNLVRNALKFTPAGGRVIVRVRAEPGLAIVEVEDNGAGIRPADIPKLFQAFSQVHDKMEKTDSGTGLGLYVARGIVESHGGRIEAHSTGLGEGATFRFSLPS